MLLVGVSGCTGNTRDASSPSTTGPRLSEVDVRLPGPVTAIADLDGRPLLGTYAKAARPRAALGVLQADGSAVGLTPVPIAPQSPYAYEGSWRDMQVADGRFLALAGAVGGAHGNVRWTIWRGGPDAVIEEPQTFETFGGTQAGGLKGVGYLGTGPFVAGSWKSADTGLDIGIWRPDGARWFLDEAAGTPLASTASALVQANAVVSGRSRALLLGSVTMLTPGEVSAVPAVWWAGPPPANGAAPVWTRSDLPRPEASGPGQVEAGGCQDQRCLLVGRLGTHLAAWQWDGNTGSITKIPALPVAPDDRVIAAVVGSRDAWIVLSRKGSGSVLHTGLDTAAGRSGLLPRAGATWTVTRLSARPTAAAGVAGQLWVATDGPAGPRLLTWSS